VFRASTVAQVTALKISVPRSEGRALKSSVRSDTGPRRGTAVVSLRKIHDFVVKCIVQESKIVHPPEGLRAPGRG